jgi:FemAB-related protein (PEP-CTERM system-associated)
MRSAAYPIPQSDASGPIEIESPAAGPQSEREWDRFVCAQPDATGYHQWRWQRVFQDGLGHRSHYLLARQCGHVVGVLPLVEVRSRVFGRALSSLPYVNYGGVLAASDEAARVLVQRAEQLARERSLSYVVLRHRRRQFQHLPARTHKVTMTMPLAADRDAMWKALDGKVRNQIRKAEKSGLTTQSGGRELLDEFYAVFARNMRDLGSPVYGRSLFASILETFPRDAGIHLVLRDGRTIAGALTYAFGGIIEVPSASSLREHRALCPNHLMYWSMICQAIADGRKTFDFGRSTPGDGTYHFKEQWGAVPEALCWEYCLKNEPDLPSTDRQSPRMAPVISAWQRLPVAVATLLGPHIARAIP